LPDTRAGREGTHADLCTSDGVDLNDALLVVDVVSEFDHDDGDTLLASFRERLTPLRAAIDRAREIGKPVI
jgi:hypothetical protein